MRVIAADKILADFIAAEGGQIVIPKIQPYQYILLLAKLNFMLDSIMPLSISMLCQIPYSCYARFRYA